MRLTCPLCGNRDRREFTYFGADDWLDRPAADAPPDAWTDYLHLRDNPAGMTRDLWYHEQGCGSWLAVTRDTVTHAIRAVEMVAPVEPGDAPPTPASPAKKPGRKKKDAGNAA